MTKIDTSTEAVEALLKDVTQGPWGHSCESVDPEWAIVTTSGGAIIANVNGADQHNASFIGASRELVPALLAERDALKAAYTAHHPNPADYRYWEGRYRDEKARIEELEAKLTKAVGLLEAWLNVATHCTIEEGVCCCGDGMDTHASPMDCGHSPVDHGAYIASSLAEETSTTLAELTGGKDE